LANFSALLILLVMLTIVLLVALPRFGILDPGVEAIVVRFTLVVLTVELWRALRPLLFGLLPRAPVLGWGALFLRWRGRPLILPLRELKRAFVVMDTEGELIFVETKSGEVLKVCPLHWMGAADLAASLMKKVG
jgi:hypothetical protein